MKTGVLGAPEELMLVQKPVPEPGPAEVLVRVDAIAVCATDIEVLEHGLPAMVDGELPFNRGFTPGHEWMGTIVGLGPTDRREQLMDFDLFASEYGFSAGATRPISLEATALLEQSTGGFYSLSPARSTIFRCSRRPNGRSWAHNTRNPRDIN